MQPVNFLDDMKKTKSATDMWLPLTYAQRALLADQFFEAVLTDDKAITYHPYLEVKGRKFSVFQVDLDKAALMFAYCPSLASSEIVLVSVHLEAPPLIAYTAAAAAAPLH